jgi:hypothetical protein
MGEGLKSILLVYASQTGNAEAIAQVSLRLEFDLLPDTFSRLQAAAQEIGEEMPEKCGVEARVLCADKVNKEV